MFAVGYSQDGGGRVPVVGCRDDQRVKILLLYELPDITYDTGLARCILQRIETILNGFVFNIADIRYFYIGQLRIAFGQVGSAAVDPHNSDDDLVAGCGFAEDREIEDGGS